MILTVFYSPPWLLFLSIIMQHSETILSDETCSNKAAPKSNKFILIRVIFRWILNSKGLRHIKAVQQSPQSEILRKKIFTVRKFMKSFTLRLICGCPPFPLSSALTNKESFYPSFRRKATLLFLPVFN